MSDLPATSPYATAQGRRTTCPQCGTSFALDPPEKISGEETLYRCHHCAALIEARLGRREVFSHQDAITGEVVIYDVTAAAAYAMRQPRPQDVEFFLCPYSWQYASFIAKNRGLNPKAIAAYPHDKASHPVIAFLRADGQTTFIDGHHRYVIWGALGMTEFPLLRFVVGAIDPFILPHSDFTAAELEAFTTFEN